MFKRRSLQVELLLGVASCLALAAPAHAQSTPPKAPDAEDAGNNANTSDDIIVTAQKRSESIQKVPISILALNQDKLERLHIDNFVDLSRQFPSVSIRSIAPGFGNVFIRGVSSGPDGGASGSLPSVGVYLDEQPVTSIQGNIDIGMYDISRVEVLAGPQGTLYGASSQAGTIRIITNKPKSGVTEGRIDGEVTTVVNGGLGYSLSGVINLPFSPRLTLRAVGWTRHDSGYVDNVAATRTYPTSGVTIDNRALSGDAFNSIDINGARAALKIDLDDNWTVTPAVMAQTTISRGTPFYLKSLGDLKTARFFPDNRRDTFGHASLTIEGKIGDLEVTYSGSYLGRKTEALYDYSDYSYYYDTLYGLGNFIRDNNGALIDPSQAVTSKSRFMKNSQELRISTPQSGRFRVTAGAFYQFQRHDLESQFTTYNLATALSVTGWPNTVWLTAQRRIDRDLAAFGEAAFDITPNLTLTAGGRVFNAKSRIFGFFGTRANEALCFAPTSTGSGPCTDIDSRSNETGFTPRVNLAWKITPDKMVYATYSVGFRPGGINRSSLVLPYKADYLKNYEFGWKTSWADGRVRFNGAIFNDNWDDIQLFVASVQGIAEVRNVGKARVRGIESDISATLGGGISVTASGSLIDAKQLQNYCLLLDANGNPTTNCANPISLGGSRLPLSAPFKGSASARYDWVAGTAKLYLEVAGVYQGPMWSNLRAADRAIVGESEGYATVDFTAGATWGNWRASLYMRNAFDSRGEVGRLTSCTPQVCGLIYSAPVRPRTIGLKIGRDY